MSCSDDDAPLVVNLSWRGDVLFVGTLAIGAVVELGPEDKYFTPGEIHDEPVTAQDGKPWFGHTFPADIGFRGREAFHHASRYEAMKSVEMQARAALSPDTVPDTESVYAIADNGVFLNSGCQIRYVEKPDITPPETPNGND